MKIWLLNPYHGGSHQSWAEGLARHSRHSVEILSLPARFWKWRMHGAAITLSRRCLQRTDRPDLILATDMLDLSTFLALTRRKVQGRPVLLYMHENQLTYPLPRDPTQGAMRRNRGERDLHYAFINFTSMLAADRVAFNSDYHRSSCLEAFPRFLRHFPDYRELNAVEGLRERSTILPVGIDAREPERGRNEASEKKPPLVLWNQRWEYDKNPEVFLTFLDRLMDRGVPFRVALCGESFQSQPDRFQGRIDALGKRLIHRGYADSESYRSFLREAELVVSVADHEFFGVSIVEAILAETFPLLPPRLSYPELIPEGLQERCFYEDFGDLVNRGARVLSRREESRRFAFRLSSEMETFCWERVAPRYDDLFEEMSG